MMRTRKWMVALLALALLLALAPAATMEALDIEQTTDGTADAAAPGDAAGALEIESGEEEEPVGEVGEAFEPPAPVEAPPEAVPTPAPDHLAANVLEANPAAESIVRIVKPADGATVTVGEVELWCAFAYTGLNSSDYVPMDVQVLKNGKLVSEQFLTYGEVRFTDEGEKYGTILLETAGTYTIRVSVPGNGEGVWHSVTVTAEGTSAMPAPVTTRQPVTNKNPIVITSPKQGEKVLATGFPVRVRFQPGVLKDVSAYQPIYIEILNSDGDVVSDSEITGNYFEELAATGEEWELTTLELEVGGNYTLRARVGESQVWDSVQIYVIGPAYPVSEKSSGYSCTPKQDEITVNLGEDVGIGYTLTTNDDPDQFYVYGDYYIEDGEKTIQFCKGKGKWDPFTYDSAKGVWTSDREMTFTGVKVGTTTMHMYIVVDGQRYGHHAVTVHVVEPPKATPTSTPKVKLSKSTITVKQQVYTGKAIEPAVTVKVGKKTLKKGTDYTVNYKNNVKIGTATVTVKGKGGYTGSKSANFRIVPKAATWSSLKAGKKRFTAKWKKQSNITGYQVQYALKEDFTDARSVRVAKAGTLSATVKSLKSGKKYFVRIRTYKTVDGKNYYSAWSRVKSVKVK